MRLLVDTNVLIDYVCHRDEYYEQARKVFATALIGENELLLTDLSYMNCIYVAKHYGIDQQSVINTLLAIQRICYLAEISNDTIKSTLQSDWKDKEDALQYKAAISSQAEGIVTRNPKDFQASTIPIYSPSNL